MKAISERAKLFKKIRLELGLKQTELAKDLKLNPQYISNVERGTAPLPAKLAVEILKRVKPKPKRLEKTRELMAAFQSDYKIDMFRKFEG